MLRERRTPATGQNPITPPRGLTPPASMARLQELGDKQHMQFVPTDDVADNQIVGSVVARLRRVASPWGTLLARLAPPPTRGSRWPRAARARGATTS
jgi:hypothetical protein